MYILLVQELCPADFEHSTHKVGECCSVFSVAGEKNVLSVEDMHSAHSTSTTLLSHAFLVSIQFKSIYSIFSGCNFFGVLERDLTGPRFELPV